MSTEAVPRIYTAAEAAERIGLPTRVLLAIIREHRYPFVQLVAGGKPGDRGRYRWGLTEAQLAAIVEGQKRQLPPPAPPVESVVLGPVRRLPPGGKSRLKLKLRRQA